MKFRPEHINRPKQRKFGFRTAKIGDEDFHFLFIPRHRDGVEMDQKLELALSLPSDRVTVLQPTWTKNIGQICNKASQNV